MLQLQTEMTEQLQRRLQMLSDTLQHERRARKPHKKAPPQNEEGL